MQYHRKTGFKTSLFTNKVDGYAVRVPAGMKVDMTFSNVRAVLENDTEKIESYINYSNQFINNMIDHYKIFTRPFITMYISLSWAPERTT